MEESLAGRERCGLSGCQSALRLRAKKTFNLWAFCFSLHTHKKRERVLPICFLLIYLSLGLPNRHLKLILICHKIKSLLPQQFVMSTHSVEAEMSFSCTVLIFHELTALIQSYLSFLHTKALRLSSKMVICS